MEAEILDRLRQKLLAKKRELQSALNIENQTEGEEEGKDPLDAAAAYTNRELIARQMDQHRQLLSEVEEALERIEDGVYGLCLGSGDAIPIKRLEAIPWARYTIEHQEKLEQGLVD